MEKRFDNLEEAMMKELEKLNKKYGGDSVEMSVQDLEKVDTIYHTLKSAETYYAMKDGGMEGGRSFGYGSYNSSPMSYRRDSMGRYASRDDGFSGHFPPYPMGYEYRY